MKRKLNGKRIVCGLVLAAMFVGTAFSSGTPINASTTATMDEYDDLVSTSSVDKSILPYVEYLEANEAAYPSTSIVITADDVSRYDEADKNTEPVIYKDYEGSTGNSVYTSENSLVEFDFEVEEAGLYNICLNYYPIAGKNSNIERAFFVDGKLPYQELSDVAFTRVWRVDAEMGKDEASGSVAYNWSKDNQGNQNKPSMKEIPEWESAFAYDNQGYIATPLAIYLSKGAHTLSLLSLREPVVIKEITLGAAKQVSSYNEVKATWNASATSGQLITIEGENASKTSSQMLYPVQDQSSPTVSPASPKELLNNTIGGNSWRLTGQWIEWEFDVKQDGLYNIALYDCQNYVRGVYVSRRITIDGEVPFSEMEAYGFKYAQSWREDTLSDAEGTPYDFYLTAGHHTIRMEVVLGDFAEIIGAVENCVQQLNSIYRQVIKITGVNPDTYRDYQIESCLPNLTNELIEVRDGLNDAIKKLTVLCGSNSDKVSTLLTMRDHLNDLIKDNEYFTRTLPSFKVNVRACGNWVTSVATQPLAIDRIMVKSADTKVKYKNQGFFPRVGYEIQRLFYSFIIDYNQIGNVADNADTNPTITLWIGSGRDQANVIKGLIDKTFTNEKNVNVNVQLVDMSALLRAELAGEGPDVAIQVANTSGIAGAVLNTGNDTPVNYGIRNAVLDLSQFSDLPEVLDRFTEAAAVPFQFNGATYGLPETTTFPVMFYRKDILAELGIEPPKSWDEVKVTMAVLAKNQMEFGMLPSEQIFAMLLYQNGGEYYTEGGMSSALDSDIAVNTFKQYTEFYTDYGLDKSTSVEERFRTGECPIVIADYTVYNNLVVSAPDIAGLWGFTTVPGTVQEDGSINHATGCTGLASIIMADTKYPQECWEFLKWWTSAETQTMYGREMESLMGSAARVPTANLVAFENMPWPVDDLEALKDAFTYIKGIPQVPGGYYTWRNVNNAFYTVTTETDTASPREELQDKIIYINAEIHSKREEFGLPVEK